MFNSLLRAYNFQASIIPWFWGYRLGLLISVLFYVKRDFLSCKKLTLDSSFLWHATFQYMGEAVLMLRSTWRHELSLKPWRTLCTWSKVKTGGPLASVHLMHHTVLCYFVTLSSIISVGETVGSDAFNFVFWRTLIRGRCYILAFLPFSDLPLRSN